MEGLKNGSRAGSSMVDSTLQALWGFHVTDTAGEAQRSLPGAVGGRARPQECLFAPQGWSSVPLRATPGGKADRQGAGTGTRPVLCTPQVQEAPCPGDRCCREGTGSTVRSGRGSKCWVTVSEARKRIRDPQKPGQPEDSRRVVRWSGNSLYPDPRVFTLSFWAPVNLWATHVPFLNLHLLMCQVGLQPPTLSS